MKKIYMTPELEEVITLTAEDILSLSQSKSVATIDDGPSVGFDQFR